MATSLQATRDFSGLGIAPRLLETIERLQFQEPTPVQSRSIPIGIEGKDLIAVAQTGTGKTLAFGIPMLQRLAQVKGRGLILLPTRELAAQVDESLHQIGRSMGLRTALLIGGASMVTQRNALRRNPHVIIATPGRLLDHIAQRTIDLRDVKILVLDEADRMLDMGFAPQINKILAVVPRQRQTMLFSATMPKGILDIAHRHMALPIHIEIAPSGTAAEKVVQEVFFVQKESKTRLLEALLAEYPGSVLVFTRTKHLAKRLARQVNAMGHTSADIHSNRSLAQRKEALEGFKSGKYRVLVATDIAARGIHVTGIELVVNYDMPSVAEDYVHRIGRTGRAGSGGKAISFATFDQRRDVKDIERLVRKTLPIKQLPDLPPPRAVPEQEHHQQGRPHHRGGFQQRRQYPGQHHRQRRPFGTRRQGRPRGY